MCSYVHIIIVHSRPDMKTKYLSMDKENIMHMCVCARMCVCVCVYTASEKEEPCCLQQYERALEKLF